MQTTSINSFFNIDERLLKLNGQITEKCGEKFREIDSVTEFNQLKVLSAFIKNGVSEAAMAGSTGYGYDDRGREILERVMADAMGAEDALMRHNFVSGTHTLTVALFGILRPNDRVLCLTGRPYDTITGVFGIDEKTEGYMISYYLNGITAIIGEWIKNDCKDEISYIENVIIACVRPMSAKKEENA